MVVMPANNSNAHKLNEIYPGQLGMIMSPGGWRDPKGLPYICDNDRYTVWRKGKEWCEQKYFSFLDRVIECGTSPRGICVPDRD